jgi:hypothetical protein
MFPECYPPVGFHSNPNLAHLILILSWLMSGFRLVTTAEWDKTHRRVALQEQSCGALI